MKALNGPALILVSSLLGACGSQNTIPVDAPVTQALPLVSISSNQLTETILLVSLGDGSVIMQTIHTDADICFKLNSDSATTCLTRGEPVYDPETDAVVGYRMVEEQIELVAKPR